MKTGRWLAWGLPGLLIVGLAVSEALGWRFLRGPAEDFLTRQLERPVRIAEPFRLHLIDGIRLQMGGIWIAAPPGFDLPHLVDARDLYFKLRYRDLWTLRKTGAQGGPGARPHRRPGVGRHSPVHRQPPGRRAALPRPGLQVRTTLLAKNRHSGVRRKLGKSRHSGERRNPVHRADCLEEQLDEQTGFRLSPE